MKTKFFNEAGKANDKRLQSCAGFCELNALYCKEYGVENPYFVNAAFAELCTCYKSQSADEKGEAAERAARVYAEKVWGNMSEEQKRALPLFAIMSEADQMSSILYSNYIAFVNKAGVMLFAKVQKVAFNANQMSEEQRAAYDKKCEESEESAPAFELICGVANEAKSSADERKDFDLYVKSAFADGVRAFLANQSEPEQREQRTKVCTKMQQGARFWFDNDNNVCTLVAEDKFNYAKTLPILGRFIFAAAAEENKKRIAEQREERKAAQKREQRAKSAERLSSFAENLQKVLDQMSEKSEADQTRSANAFIKRVQTICAAANKAFEPFESAESEAAAAESAAANAKQMSAAQNKFLGLAKSAAGRARSSYEKNQSEANQTKRANAERKERAEQMSADNLREAYDKAQTVANELRALSNKVAAAREAYEAAKSAADQMSAKIKSAADQSSADEQSAPDESAA